MVLAHWPFVRYLDLLAKHTWLSLKIVDSCPHCRKISQFKHHAIFSEYSFKIQLNCGGNFFPKFYLNLNTLSKEYGNFSSYVFLTDFFNLCMSYRSGSPSMEDIESFSTAYSTRLDEAGVTGSVPDNISLEVRIPFSPSWTSTPLTC